MKKRIILLLSILAIMCIAFVGCGKEENTEIQTITNPSQEVLNNVKKEYVITKDEKIAIKLTNNNESNLQGLNVNVTYYDEKGNLLSSDNQQVQFISANSEFIINSYLPTDEEYNTIYPGNISINLTTSEYNEVKNEKDKLGIKHNKSATGSVIIEYTNNAEGEVYAEMNIVYYKSNNIVACDSTTELLASGEVKSIEFYKPMDSDGNEIEYDTYKLYYNCVSFNEVEEDVSEEVVENEAN